MDWLASAAGWLREQLGELAWLDALKPTIDGLPDWALVAAGGMIAATLVLAIVILVTRMRPRPKGLGGNRHRNTQDAVLARDKGPAKSVAPSSTPSRWTVSMEAKLQNAAPLDFDKIVALTEDVEFAAAGLTVRGIAAKARSMGLAVVNRSAVAAVDPGISPEKANVLPLKPTIERAKIAQSTNSDALFGAIATGNLEEVKYWLAAGVDPNARGGVGGATPLHVAISTQNYEAARLLLEKGADPATPMILEGEGEALSLLEISAALENAELVSLFLQYEPSQKAKDNALFGAAETGNSEILSMLLAAGAVVGSSQDDPLSPARGSFPLLTAATSGHDETVKRLLAGGADVRQVDSFDGQFALLMASENGHADCVRLLLAAGADVNQTNTTNGTTPLWSASANGHAEIVRLLIEAGAGVDFINPEQGSFPLLMAAQVGHHATVEELLQAGANPNLASPMSGNLPLHLAVQTGDAGIVGLLVAAGAQPEHTHPRTVMTPLELAILNNRNDLVEALGYR
jgi:ankyrin repeat protein